MKLAEKALLGFISVVVPVIVAACYGVPYRYSKSGKVVDKDTGQMYVNQREGEEIVRTDVVLGILYEGIAQVLSGLSEGDEAIWVEDSSFGFGPQ